MSTAPTTITSTANENSLQRFRAFLGAAIFLLVRRSPKLLELHRNEKSWTLLRVAIGIFGAALVVLPLTLWNGWFTALFGMCLFIASILMPPPDTESDTDRKARELGAQTVVNGGMYQPGNAPAAQARLFVSPAHVWALDKNFEPLLVISTPDIYSLRAVQGQDCWLLQIRWLDHMAEFSYVGFFADRFARLAEESIRAFATQASPSSPRKRAARA